MTTRSNRGARFWSTAVVLFSLLTSAAPRGETPPPVHRQRYAMGTMFEIVVYHPSRPDAVRAVERAMAEIVRLDRVMSHFRTDSELSKLIRDGRNAFTRVEPSLYEVLEASVDLSRRSNGTFDVTIAPLVRTWRSATEAGRRPSAHEIEAALGCVGYEKMELRGPDRVRLRSDCLEIDLGGIGKGYAVDRAIAILSEAGVEHALVNAGGSSIAAIGSPPGRTEWPVSLGSTERTFLLREGSLSISGAPLLAGAAPSAHPADIIDPHRAAPAARPVTVTVVAPTATVSDGLSTTLVMLAAEDGMKLLAQYAGASAVWLSAGGEIEATYGGPGLQLSGLR